MSEVTVVAGGGAFTGCVAESDDVELRLPTRTGGIDWEKDRPSDATANKSHDNANLQKTQEKETIHGLCIENGGIGYAEKGAKPVERAFGNVRRPFSGDD